MADVPLDRTTVLDDLIGVELMEKVRNSKVLVVGAGGIGCELLKNIALTGFGNITVIDLDTIDVSPNLFTHVRSPSLLLRSGFYVVLFLWFASLIAWRAALVLIVCHISLSASR